MTLMVAGHLDTSGAAILGCFDSARADNTIAQMEWSDLTLSANRLDEAFNQPPE